MKSPLRTLLAKTPVPYTSGTTNLTFPSMLRGGSEAQMRAMGAVGTVFSIVNKTAGATSQVHWMLYRKKVDGRRQYAAGEPVDNRVELIRHAALDLWNRPNPFYTRQRFVETSTQHIDLTGESYWVVGRNPRSKLPLELWPVRPDRIEPVPHPTEFLAGYVYTGPGGEKVPLRVDEVIALQMPNPLDPYHGLGPVQSIFVDIDASRYTAEWNRNFFINGARPGGIIEVEKHLDDTEFNELTTRWREQHQGVAGAHRVAVLEQGMKWVETKLSQDDMQFSELRSMNREIIREAFGFPKPMLGSSDDVNRANAEAAEVVFARWLLIPRLERIKEALNTHLLPMLGATDVEFDYVNPIPEDRATDAIELTARSNAALTLINAGYDAAQVLETVGLPAMKHETPPVPAPPPPKELPPAESAPSARSVSLFDVVRALPVNGHAQPELSRAPSTQ